jgi:hypothetical protein
VDEVVLSELLPKLLQNQQIYAKTGYNALVALST